MVFCVMLNRLPVFCAVPLFLSACSAMIDSHGDAIDPEIVASLIPGETVYTEVQKKLGSPSSRTVFDTENWIYLHSEQERLAFFKPKETYRKIIVLKFNTEGVLQKIETKTLENGRSLSPSSARTLTDRETLTILDQMISNVGRMGTDTPVR